MSDSVAAPVLRLRPAAPDDCRFVYDVNAHPSVRAQAIRTGEIPWDVHQAWFARRLADETCTLQIAATEADEDIGVVRFDRRGDEATISVALAVSARGRGLGTALIGRATRLCFEASPIARVVALIRPTNIASLRAFERAGYVRAGSCTVHDVQLERYIASRPPSGAGRG